MLLACLLQLAAGIATFASGAELPIDFGPDLLPLKPWDRGCHLFRIRPNLGNDVDVVEVYVDICPHDDAYVAAHRLCTRWELGALKPGLACASVLEPTLQTPLSELGVYFPLSEHVNVPRRAKPMRAYLQQLVSVEEGLFRLGFQGPHEGYMAQVWEKLETLWELRSVRDLDANLQLPPDAGELPASVNFVCEIGFNMGASALFWLATSNVTVISFDLGEHPYVLSVADTLARGYPGRLLLIVGDSAESIPRLAAQNDVSCDVILIDGSHLFADVVTDLRHMAMLSRPRVSENNTKDSASIIVLDDAGMFQGVNDAWEFAWQRGWVQHVRSVSGKSSPSSFASSSGVVLGRYLFTHFR